MGCVATHASVTVSGSRKIVVTSAGGRRVVCMVGHTTSQTKSQGASGDAHRVLGTTISCACIAGRMAILSTPAAAMVGV